MKKESVTHKRLLDYLKENPEATVLDVKLDGFRHPLEEFYHGSLNDAKRKAGVADKYIRESTKGKNKG